jgi:WD40 repeat protein
MIQRVIVRLVLLPCLLVLAGCGTLFPAPATATPSPSTTLTETPAPTATATRTATPTATPTPTSTPTPTAVLAGTPYLLAPEPLMELNLDRAVELARWGRGQVRDLVWNGDTLFAATDLGVYVYEAGTLNLRQVLDAGPVSRLAVSPNGADLFAAGESWSHWDVLTGSGEPITDQGLPLAIAFFADRNVINYLVQDVGSPAEYVSNMLHGPYLLAGQSNPLSGAIISPDLNLVAGWDHSGGLSVWRSDGSKLFDLPPAIYPRGPAVFSPDSKLLAVAQSDAAYDFKNTNQITLYSLPDGKPLFELFPNQGVEGYTQRILSLSFSPDGSRIAAGYANRTIDLWRTQAGPAERTLSGLGIPFALAFAPDGLRLASGGLDVWDLQDGSLLASLPEHLPPAQDLAISPDGSLAALAGFGQVELRRVSDGQVERVIADPGLEVNAVAFSPDGALLAGACADGTARLWRVRDGRYLTLMAPPTGRLWSVAFSPDGTQILIGGEDGLIQRYEIIKDIITLEVREPYLAAKLVFSPVGTLFGVLTSSGASIRDVEFRLTRQISGVGLEDMAFSVDGGALALAGREILQVIDVGTGLDFYSQFDPQHAAPTALAYSDNGAFLAVGRADGSIDILWASDGLLLRTLTGHRSRVRHLAFTPDAMQLLSAADDGTVRVWGVN